MTDTYPLQWPKGWPRTASYNRVDAGRKFGMAPFAASVDRLEDELRRLGATNCIMSTNLRTRMDGRPYSDQGENKIDDPGVAIYFTLRGKSMSMGRDAYRTVRDNVRSLALAIEYMRGLERHGGATMVERAFSGFTALPPPEGNSEPDVDWRVEFGPIPDGFEQHELLALIESRYKHKAKTAHSDQGGSDTAMIRLNLAIGQARRELST